jgi:hypothetical protein
MPRTKPSAIAAIAERLDDPAEAVWRAEVARVDQVNQKVHERRQAFMRQRSDALRAGRKPPKAPAAGAVTYEPWPPALPDFGATTPAIIGRQVLGRFIHDRDHNVLHDCQAAQPACAIDDVTNGTFVHFVNELVVEVPGDARPCAHCLSEEA